MKKKTKQTDVSFSRNIRSLESGLCGVNIPEPYCKRGRRKERYQDQTLWQETGTGQNHVLGRGAWDTEKTLTDNTEL